MDNINAFAEKHDRATLTDAAASTDSIFFEKKKPEVRKVLRKKLIAVKQQKQTLEDVITTKNNEIDELKKSISSLNEVINSVPFDDLKNKSTIASEKLIEISKKNRMLRSEIESIRSRNIKLERKLQKLEIELKKATTKKNLVVQKMADGPLEKLQSQLNQTKQKLFESLNQNVELKNQLKLAQKCIQQEIGENVNLNILATSGTTWRGRAQQILTLQLKINELKDQLDSVRGSGWPEDYPDEPPVRREQIYHRAEIDVLQKDITTLTTHIEEQNQKIAALKARNKNLVTDVTKMKEKCASLEALVNSNDSTIESLKDKLNVQKFHYENRIRDIQKQITDTQKDRNNFELHQEEMKIKVENLQIALDNREEHITDLNTTIKKLERDLKSVCGDYLFECRDFKKEEFIAMLDSLESEKNSLLTLNKTTNERLDAERSRVLSLTDQISKQKIKICRLEGRIRDIEKDQDTQIEKKRRTQRISEYANSINNNNSTVSSLVFENTSLTNMPQSCGDGDIKCFELAELRHKLEFAKEKINILEDKLSYLNEEKQNDAKTFENIIKMSKSVFLDTIHQAKKETSLQTETE